MYNLKVVDDMYNLGKIIDYKPNCLSILAKCLIYYLSQSMKFYFKLVR